MPDRDIATVTVENKFMSVMMLLVGLGLIAMAIIFPDPPKDITAKYGLQIVLILSGLLPIVLCPRYKISFRPSEVLITIGYLNVFKVKIKRDTIIKVGPREWNPMKHFGGSGIKGGMGEFKGYQCFNIFSGSGIEILTTGRNYVIEMTTSQRSRLLAMIGDYAQANKRPV